MTQQLKAEKTNMFELMQLVKSHQQHDANADITVDLIDGEIFIGMTCPTCQGSEDK